jgi:L,D-transpeptidase YcbB
MTMVRLGALALCALVLQSSPLAQALPQPGSEPIIAGVLRHLPADATRAAFENDVPALVRFYEQRGYEPAWIAGSGLSAAGRNILAEIRNAAVQGLNASEYLLEAIDEHLRGSTPADLAELDVLLSLAVARYAHDLGWGITLPSEVDRDNAYQAREFAADAVLGRIVGAPDPTAALRAYEPPTFVYREMKQALAELRAVQAAGGWKALSEGPVLREGDSGPRVQELRDRLVERGDVPREAAVGDVFDATLKSGLQRFQDRHGLEPDGICGKAVRSELNVPVGVRIQQVRLAMERIRWLPPPTNARRVAVNLADFRAYVFDGDSITFETRAVIGKQFHETPMFTATMTYVVINPYWNVPPSIARAEILPKVRADPGYLARNHMVRDGNTIRQLPGPWNSLGRLKFMFPNPHNVYLHDTPARTLFAMADRAFSHGCIRLEHPAELAALLLGPQGWTPERIQAAIDTGQQQVVTLDQPIPVTISYATAFRTPDGLLHYRRDVYGRDRKLLAALTHRSQGSWEQ